jgi:hypothetical protein
MSYLKSLTFTTADSKLTPIMRRRMALIERLRDQMARISDPHRHRVKAGWVKVNGEKTAREQKVSVKPWWTVGPDGQVVFCVRQGVKRIEFEKGKTGIVVPSVEELPKVIDELIGAVGRGELDHLISPGGAQEAPGGTQEASGGRRAKKTG